MTRNKFIIWIRLNWLKLLLIFLAATFLFTVITMLVLGFQTFFGMETFSRKQMMAQMGMYLLMGIVQAVIYVVLFGFMQYYTFMGGGMSKMLGTDAAEEAKPDVKWADVIGMELVKRDAWEIVEFLRDQTRLKDIGGKIIKGTLFMGPPGCGKTYLAKAIATEADMPFLAAVGSEFVGMIVGQGAARMRSLFKKARKLAKVYGGCIIFIDEIDSFATPRKEDMGFGGQTSQNATVNQFLTEIDGLRKKENNIVIFAATNLNEEQLDPAIVRSGRFDRKIRVDYPNRQDREDIMYFYLNRIKYNPECDIKTLAKETMWFSPADLDSMVREAAIFARREKAEMVTNVHLQKAKEHLIGLLSKNGAKNLQFAQQHVYWDNIIGMEAAKKEVWEIITRMRDSKQSKGSSNKLARAYLFYGSSGTGKTHLIKAVATEAGFPVVPMSAPDILAMSPQDGRAELKRIFEETRSLNRTEMGCILYISNIDVLVWDSRHISFYDTVQNFFLSSLDDVLDDKNNIYIFAETCLSDDQLSKQLLQPNRFSQKLQVLRPGVTDRPLLIKHFLKDVPLDLALDHEQLVKKTICFSINDLRSMIKEAQLLASREKTPVNQEHFNKAIDKTIKIIEKATGGSILATRANVPWDNVIGMEATKKEIWEIVTRMRDSRLAQGSSHRLARSYLFYGSSGTGKTHLIKAAATESGFPLVSMNASEIMAMPWENTHREIKRIFEETRALSRTETGCILYINNIEALVWDSQYISYYDPLQNFFLNELDEVLNEKNNIFIFAETSLGEDSLSKRLLQPNRFSQKLLIPRPGSNDRLLLIQHFLKDVPYDPALDMEQMIKKTMWFSVNDLRSMVKEAQLLASRDQISVNVEHFNKAIDKTVEIIEKAAGGFIMATRVNIAWDSVIGMDSAKKDAWEIVELMKDRERIKAVGGKVVKGTMMIGPPGCGKTYLAKAIATEAGLPFLSVAGSEFVGIYVGTGAEKMKQLFTEARSLAKAEGGCLVFIDEVDSFARPRTSGSFNAAAETSHNATINQFLTELDGLRKQENNIVVLAATNFQEDQLDPAIMRSGRFERVIHIDRPNLKERKQLFQFYMKKVKVADDVNLGILSRKTLWFSPADIDHMVREAALLSMRNKSEVITFKDLSEAYDRISYGTKSNMVRTPEQNERTAYHESGHAIIGYIFLQHEDVIKATIIPRAGALGFVAPRGRYEVHGYNREELRSNLKFGLASYAAEMIKFGTTATGVGGGPGSDFYRALQLAQRMVWSYGMGPSGLIGDFLALDNGWSSETHISEKTREKLDSDVQAILQECMKECFDTLNTHRDLLEYFAQELIKKEELEYDEIEAIFDKFNVKPKFRPPFLEEDEGNA